MSDEIPPGWLPIPHAVDPEQADVVAAALIRRASETIDGLVDDETARSQAAAAMRRPAIEPSTIGRLWHVLGPGATGLVVDLSVHRGAADLHDRAGAGFAAVHVQRRIDIGDGLATIAIVAPDDEAPPAVLLRAQRVEQGNVLTADVLDTDLGLIGQVVDDVLRLVGARSES